MLPPLQIKVGTRLTGGREMNRFSNILEVANNILAVRGTFVAIESEFSFARNRLSSGLVSLNDASIRAII